MRLHYPAGLWLPLARVVPLRTAAGDTLCLNPTPEDTAFISTKQ